MTKIWVGFLKWIAVAGLFLAVISPGFAAAEMNTNELMAKIRMKPMNRIPLMSFELKDPDGNLVSIDKFKGKVMLVNLWDSG